jgi:hypothetical protein
MELRNMNISKKDICYSALVLVIVIAHAVFEDRPGNHATTSGEPNVTKNQAGQ